jgi:hypothetical protein
MRTYVKWIILVALLLFAVSQFFHPDRTNPIINPTATFEAVAKPSPDAAAIFQRACYDCHSNTTIWPWYSRIAPVSWLVADDVKAGRAHMNFSEWGLLGPEVARERLRNACSEVTAGEMPLWIYRVMHPNSKLSAGDIQVICSAAAQR